MGLAQGNYNQIRIGSLRQGGFRQRWWLQKVQPPRLDDPFDGFVRANRRAFQQRGGSRGKIEVIVNDRRFQRRFQPGFLSGDNYIHATLLLSFLTPARERRFNQVNKIFKKFSGLAATSVTGRLAQNRTAFSPGGDYCVRGLARSCGYILMT